MEKGEDARSRKATIETLDEVNSSRYENGS